MPEKRLLISAIGARSGVIDNIVIVLSWICIQDLNPWTLAHKSLNNTNNWYINKYYP